MTDSSSSNRRLWSWGGSCTQPAGPFTLDQGPFKGRGSKWTGSSTQTSKLPCLTLLELTVGLYRGCRALRRPRAPKIWSATAFLRQLTTLGVFELLCGVHDGAFNRG